MKESWVGNIPYVLATLDFEQRQIDPRTPDGLYNSILQRTGSKEQAEKARMEFRSAIELTAAIKKRPKGFG